MNQNLIKVDFVTKKVIHETFEEKVEKIKHSIANFNLLIQELRKECK